MSSLRRTLKRTLPGNVKGLAQPLRDFILGPAIEDEVLRPITFERDRSTRLRLNFVLPSLDRAKAFGGVMTGVELFLELGETLARTHQVDLRVVTENPVAPEQSVIGSDQAEEHCLQANENRLPVRSSDLFLVYNWWIALNLEPVLRAQAETFGVPPRPKLYLIQEYEPHFYPFSSAHMLSLQAFNGDWPIWGIFNSSELHGYYKAQGNRSDRDYPFEPRMNPSIRPFAKDLSAAEKTRTVLVYGRPQVARNCFSLIRKGLDIWAETHGAEHPDWRFISAGETHKAIPLGPHHALTSAGKLPLEAYGKLLRETAVGVSLMSSPHPSYPPLEMAHFGARVIGNSYPHKDLSRRHDNLRSLTDIRPEAIAAALEQEILAFERDPESGVRAQSHMPNYMSETPFDCLEALASDISELMEAT